MLVLLLLFVSQGASHAQPRRSLLCQRKLLYNPAMDAAMNVAVPVVLKMDHSNPSAAAAQAADASLDSGKSLRWDGEEEAAEAAANVIPADADAVASLPAITAVAAPPLPSPPPPSPPPPPPPTEAAAEAAETANGIRRDADAVASLPAITAVAAPPLPSPPPPPPTPTAAAAAVTKSPCGDTEAEVEALARELASSKHSQGETSTTAAAAAAGSESDSIEAARAAQEQPQVIAEGSDIAVTPATASLNEDLVPAANDTANDTAGAAGAEGAEGAAAGAAGAAGAEGAAAGAAAGAAGAAGADGVAAEGAEGAAAAGAAGAAEGVPIGSNEAPKDPASSDYAYGYLTSEEEAEFAAAFYTPPSAAGSEVIEYGSMTEDDEPLVIQIPGLDPNPALIGADNSTAEEEEEAAADDKSQGGPLDGPDPRPIAPPPSRFRRCNCKAPTAAQRRAVEAKMTKYKRYRSAQTNAGGKSLNPITVGTVFHIVLEKPKTGPTDEQIRTQVAVLNSAYASADVTFRLAGVLRYVDAAVFAAKSASGAEVGFKKATRKGSASVLNVYLWAPADGYLGWATFPWTYSNKSWDDGVVVRFGTLPGGPAAPYNMGRTMVHEVGGGLGGFMGQI